MSVALVTGAASGIGAATATLLRARGWDVFGTDITEGEDLFRHDVRDEAAWDAAVSACVSRFGRLDALVSNAGTADAGPIVDLDMARFRDLCTVHVDGAWLGARAAVAQMRAQGSPARGSIVIVASIAGVKPLGGTAAYGSAKRRR
jgi:NAD(P)-dependent dehydrogenase (short-subunit alcohol dehydrogenase family)